MWVQSCLNCWYGKTIDREKEYVSCPFSPEIITDPYDDAKYCKSYEPKTDDDVPCQEPTQKHFEEDAIRAKLDLVRSRQVHILDQAGTDYQLVYCHFPTDSDRDYFEFKGIPVGETFPEVLFHDKDLSVVLRQIREHYPCMEPADWETYRKLSEAVKTACAIRGFAANDKTRQEEDDAVQRLCDFTKEHRL